MALYVGGTGDANKFDDYEEGTWTPSPHDGSVDNANCKYTKTGNTVHCWGLVDNFSDRSTNDQIKIGGLPFVPTNNHVAGGAMSSYTSDVTNVHAYVTTSSQVTFYGNDTAAYNQYRHNEISSTSSQIHLSFTYHTAT